MTYRKYRNTPTVVDGHRFPSKREAARYCDLKTMQRAGEIEALELQPAYDLCVNGFRVCKYVADFRYLDRRTGETIVEDVKGVRTDVFKIKAKMMRACHGIQVVEI